MKLANLRGILLSVLALAVVIAWAIVINVAISISEIVLANLHMIVELAGMP
jgi:hypothetical protein